MKRTVRRGDIFYAKLDPHIGSEQGGTRPVLILSNDTGNRFSPTLGFGGSYLFADNLEEGRLMVLSNRGFLPVESVGTLPPAGLSIKRLPICRGGRQVMRNYCAFWRKDQSNYYIEEFADILRKLMTKEQDSD